MIPLLARMRLVCIGAVLLLPVSAFSAEDLLHYYQLALQNDPKLRSAEANRGAVDERLSQAWSSFGPTLTATAARNRNDQRVITDSFIFSQPPGHAEYSSSEYRLNLSQPIFRADLFAGVRAARAEASGAEYQYQATRQEMLSRVAQAYFDVLLAQETLLLTRKQKDAIAHQLESARARLKAGLSPITDVHDAEAGYQTAVSDETEAQNTLDDKREALREISGQRPQVLSTLGNNLPQIPPEPADIEQWVQTSAQQNLTVLAATAMADAAKKNVERNQAGHYPSVDFVGSRTRTDADASIPGPGVRSDNTVLGVQLTVPIFQGGQISARTREAAYRYNAAQQELTARQRQTERATRSAYRGVMGGITKMDALQRSVNAAGESLKAKTEGYSAGLYVALDVLNATRDLYRMQRDLAQVRYTYVISLIQLKQSAGTLNDQDLETLNGWLQTE